MSNVALVLARRRRRPDHLFGRWQMESLINWYLLSFLCVPEIDS